MAKTKPKEQQPFLPMFVGDFMAATAEWEGEEQSLYALLLMHQWAIGSLPTEIAKLARLVRYDQHTFERWWPTVSSKFVTREGDGGAIRLVNLRLEIHRQKTIALQKKNAEAGKKGAEKRWRNDGERHADDMADANDGDGERHQSANGRKMAVAKKAPLARGYGNPSHPDPIHPDPRQGSRSPQEPTVLTQGKGQGSARVNGEDGDHDPTGAYALLQRIQRHYPAGTYRGSNWIQAEDEISKLLDGGEPPEALEEAAKAYRAQQDAKRSTGTQYVLSPENFYGPEGHWRGPFPLPQQLEGGDANREQLLQRIRRSGGTRQ